MFKEAKKMVDNRLLELNNVYLKNFTITNPLDMLSILNNADKIANQLNQYTNKINKITLKNGDVYYEEDDKDLFEQILKEQAAISEENEDEITYVIGTDYRKETIEKLNLPIEFTKLLGDEDTNKQLEKAIKNLVDNKNSIRDLKQLNKLYELQAKGLDLVENELYNFLEEFQLSLEDNSKSRTSTILQLLKQEEQSLISSSSISNYLAEGIKNRDLQQAINTLKLLKSVVNSMSTTELSYGDPIGFIASRQNFVKRNKITSDTISLKTISSDTATLMNKDLDRYINKLEFILNISKSNSSKMFNEQEAVREIMTKTNLETIKSLIKQNPMYKGNPVIPDLTEILNSKDSNEKKLMKIETLIYEANKDNKAEAFKVILEFLNITDNKSVINKDFKSEDITDYERAIYLATIFSINSRDHFIKDLNILEDIAFNKAPFYTQELAAKVMMASTVSPELFQMITENMDENTKTELLKTDLITFILGGGGTGKTTVVFKMLVKALLPDNPNLSI